MQITLVSTNLQLTSEMEKNGDLSDGDIPFYLDDGFDQTLELTHEAVLPYLPFHSKTNPKGFYCKM
jgi:hypothetical protein